MTRFMQTLGRRCARHPFTVFACWLVVGLAVLSLDAAIGGSPTDNCRVPGVEAQAANDVLAANFPSQSGWSGRVVFHTERGRLDEPRWRAVISTALERARSGTDVVVVSDPFDPARPTISADGTTAFATINYSQNAPRSAYFDDAAEVAEVGRAGGLQTELSGDIARPKTLEGGEAVGLLAAIVVLLAAFGSVIAMGVPIATALVGLVIGLGGVGLLAGTTNVATNAPILASMIGLGVGIDYALFVVTRFRENLDAGMEPEEAVGHANATAGLSVLFAGLTVVVAICGLMMAGVPGIATMGFAAAIIVLVAMAVAVTLLPALLGLIGTRIDRFSLHRRSRRSSRTDGNVAARWAHHVGRRPWRYALASLTVLAALAMPITAMRIGFADDSNTAADATEHRAYGLLADAFGPGFNGPFVIVAELPDADTRSATLDRLVTAVEADAGIAAVQPPLPSPSGTTAVVIAQPTTGPQATATARTLDRLRHELPSVLRSVGARHGQVLITGRTASFGDLSQRLSSRLPLFIAAVVGLSFVLLLVLFRSVLVPVKAAVMNLLSIGAAYGVVVAVFQWGWGNEFIGVHATVPVNPFVPMIMFAILFGLSMDYEVFLLSRVREEFLSTGDSHQSVVDGLASTARVITSAALIMISVFLAFVGAPNVMIKMFGLGLATAVLIDATLVRMVLVPSTMALLGRANWWLPRSLDRVLPHIDLEGAGTSSHPSDWVAA